MNSVLILLNSLNDWKPYCETDSLVTVTDYLEHRYGERKPKLVINLSDDYGYNSEGYYCSLLAQARGHRVLPGVETLNKLESGAGIRMTRSLQQQCHQWIERNRISDEVWQLNIYFGTCREKGLEKIARFIFDHYPCPILRVVMNNHARNQIESVQALPLRQLSESEQDDFANALDCFNKKVWRSPRSAKPARYNLAILYDPNEKFPPSDKDALAKFLEVARKMNIHAELITEEEATRLMEFDALFIRATTALNHYTFRLAQRAAMNDIAVIDDPESIIRCTNKVYLCELFEKARIPAPAFTYYGKEVWEQALAALLCGENLSSSRFPTDRSRSACTRSATRRSCARPSARCSNTRPCCWRRSSFPRSSTGGSACWTANRSSPANITWPKAIGRFTTTPTTTRAATCAAHGRPCRSTTFRKR